MIHALSVARNFNRANHLPLEPSRHRYQQLRSAVWCAANSEQIQGHRSGQTGWCAYVGTTNYQARVAH